MGNVYSMIDFSENEKLDALLKKQILELENNVKKVDNMLELLNLKCDKIITKVEEVDNKVYELVDLVKVDKFNTPEIIPNSEWDYYDLNQSNNNFIQEI